MWQLLQDKEDHYALVHNDWVLQSCTFGWGAVFLTFTRSIAIRELTVKIEQDFDIDVNSDRITLKPSDYTSLSLLLSLISTPIRTLQIFKVGYLSILFNTGIAIYVTKDTLFESWEIRIDNNASIVCMPDGNLAVFDGEQMGS